jgi:hypothetical protein
MREAFEESAFRMVTDEQNRRLFKLLNTEETQAIAASKAWMDVKTARKYLRAPRLPGERKSERHWPTREDLAFVCEVGLLETSCMRDALLVLLGPVRGLQVRT